MMKNFFKKMNRGQAAEADDLNLDYGDFYTGKPENGPAEQPKDNRPAGGYYDVPAGGRGVYEEPEFRSEGGRSYDERPVERPVERPLDRSVDESYVKPHDGYREPDAPGYRPMEREAEPVFTPAPAPEYLYFTPSTYRDCREGIVKGLASGHVVVVRLRSLEAGDVLRLFDYMMGAVQALDAELVRPEATTVVLVPAGAELDEDELEPEEDEYDEEEYEDEYDEEYEDEYDEEYEDEYTEEYADGEDGEDTDADVE